MRVFWKLLLIAIPLGGYLLYKKGSSSDVTGKQTKNKSTDQSTEEITEAEQEEGDSTTQITEQLTEIDGVTSRVAENLLERGIKSKEALLELSEEELKSVKGIGPKRAAKILNFRE